MGPGTVRFAGQDDGAPSLGRGCGPAFRSRAAMVVGSMDGPSHAIQEVGGNDGGPPRVSPKAVMVGDFRCSFTSGPSETVPKVASLGVRSCQARSAGLACGQACLSCSIRSTVVHTHTCKTRLLPRHPLLKKWLLTIRAANNVAKRQHDVGPEDMHVGILGRWQKDEQGHWYSLHPICLSLYVFREIL